jgi:hypothetical protein
MTSELDLMVAERAITRVILAYSRAVDRYDSEALRDCYWPDGTDDHGSFRGNRDEFVDWNRQALARFDLTCHFLGNILVDVDLDADSAVAETYAVAHHRYTDPDGQLTDMTAPTPPSARRASPRGTCEGRGPPRTSSTGSGSDVGSGWTAHVM